MPIRDYPFIYRRFVEGILQFSVRNKRARPMLWMEVINPKAPNGLKMVKPLAFVDTGSDNFAFPASVAKQLGYKLRSGPEKIVQTAGGPTKAYTHEVILNILNTLPNGHRGNKVVLPLGKQKIDFILRLGEFLVGQHGFLEHFKLHIDYPNKKFSIRWP